MYKAFICLSLCCLSLIVANAQVPKDGMYTYSIAFDEWGGKTLGATCIVLIKGSSIQIIHNGDANLSGKKGDIMAQGIIMKHVSGQWIIGSSSADINAKNIGTCNEGPTVIDFKKKLWKTC